MMSGGLLCARSFKGITQNTFRERALMSGKSFLGVCFATLLRGRQLLFADSKGKEGRKGVR